MSKQVQLDDHINKKLDQLTEKRREESHTRITKKDVVADLVFKAHRRECK